MSISQKKNHLFRSTKQASSIEKSLLISYLTGSWAHNYQNLKNTPAWLAGSAVNRDHAPSGESQNVRGDPSAYNQAFAITIPNPEMHQVHSPTFGTDNSHKNGLEDDMEGTTDKRVEPQIFTRPRAPTATTTVRGPAPRAAGATSWREPGRASLP